MSSLKPAAEHDDEAQILDAIDRFLERDVAPVAHDLEARDEWPAEIVEKMKGLGLFGATIGTEYGGLGLSASTYCKIVERVSAVWMSVSGIFNSHLIMAATVERFGTDAQKPGYHASRQASCAAVSRSRNLTAVPTCKPYALAPDVMATTTF